MLISGFFLYLVGKEHIFFWIEWNFMQTPVLKGCEKEVMCSLSNRV